MALKASPDDQEKLLDLQALDTKLAQLAHRATSLPELAALRELSTQAETLRRTLSTQTGVLEDVRLELTRVESDVAVVEARIARDAGRLQSSSSVKDVAALEQELGMLRRRLDDLEEIQLAVMERVDDQQAIVDSTSGQLDDLRLRITLVEAERDAALASLAADRAVAAAGRRAIEATVPADLLALYEKQRARYGTGASLLRGGVSVASGVKLLENELQAIRSAAPDDVIMCASSEAILVRTGESGL